MAIPVFTGNSAKPTEGAKYCSLQLKPVFTSSLLSQPMPAEDGGWGCNHAGIEQLPFPFTVKRGQLIQFSPYSFFQRGGTWLPRGEEI